MSRYIRAMFRVTPSCHRIIAAALAVAVMTLLTACTEPAAPSEPVAVDLEGAEEDLALFVSKRIGDARAQRSSGLMRGRLAMALDANGFGPEAAQSYLQADGLDRTDFRWPYFHAHVLAGQGDVEAAVRRVRHALTLEEYAAARLWLGTWLLDTGNLSESEQAFQQVREQASAGPLTDAAVTGLARVRMRQDQPEAALELLQPIVRASEHPYPRSLLVRAARAAGQQTTFAATGETAAMDWPDPKREELQGFVRGFGGRLIHAEALIESGDTAQAIEMLEAMRSERPEDRSVLNNLAVALLTSGGTGAAQVILEEALPQHDNFHLLHFNLAGVYQAQGKLDRAIAHFDRTIALQPGLLAAHERKVALLMERQQFEPALRAIRAAEDQGRVHPDMLFYAGVIEGTRGNWEEAESRFAGALALDAKHARAQLFLARTLGETGRYKEAGAALEAARELGVGPEQLRGAQDRIAELQGR